MFRESIHGMIHCTGGGQTKVMKFVDKVEIVKDNLFDTPPLFEVIQSTTNTSDKEMMEVFNMGHRIEIYTDLTTAESIIAVSKSYGIDAQIIGFCRDSESKQLRIKRGNDWIEWDYTS